MSKNYLRTIGEELLPTIAYGDAAGLPVETKSHQQIAAQYGTIDELIASRENPFYMGEFAAGTWSDDTQLSMAVARALARAGKFDMVAVAGEHVAEYNNTPQVIKPSRQVVKRGWGSSTTRAVERYIAGTPWQECGEPNGAGNGVIMKLAPLAYWLIAHSTADREAYQQLDAFTAFTHGSFEAQVASRVHYDMLAYLATEDSSVGDFGELPYTTALWHEGALGKHSNDVSSALRFLDSEKALTMPEILHRTDGKGFYVPQTLAMAYGAFIMSGGEFSDGVYTAVNLGGDTDSTASIVAAMSLFHHGHIEERPDDFAQTLQYDDLVKASRELVEAAAKHL